MRSSVIQIENLSSSSSLTWQPDGLQHTKCFVRFFLKYMDRTFINFILGRAIDYRKSVNSFVHLHTDLWPYLLSNDEWDALELVTSWLKSFRSATTQMSATKTPMLSTTHAVFRGLQEDIRNIIRTLPASGSLALKKGLTDAHRKLSDYYYKFDESPFYLWSSRKCLLCY